MKTPLFAKIFGGYLAAIVVLSLLIPAFALKPVRNLYLNLFNDNLKNLAVTLRPEISRLYEAGRYEELDAFVKRSVTQIRSRVTVIDGNGVVRADSQGDPKTMDNHRTRPEVFEALQGGIGKSLRFSHTADTDMIYVALPLDKEGRVIGVIRMSAYLKEVNVLMENVKGKIINIALIITLLSLVVAFFIARGISLPLRKLVGAAKNLAGGNFETHLISTRERDLKDLAESFNAMAIEMRRLFEELTSKNEELGAIISAIDEVLLVLDRDGRIKLANQSIAKFSGREEVEGRFYWEVLRSPEFGELIKEAKGRGGHPTAEIENNGRVFLCSVTDMPSREEMVAVLHDVTELRNLEKVKKDFIANISHELRTPLTAIKGFVETMEEEEEIRNTRYLEIIKRHTDRLMNIVNDLLLLSALEESGRPERERVDLGELSRTISRMFDPRLREKSLTMTVEGDESGYVVYGDAFKLEQMLINLLDNAIKYTEKGGITLALRRLGASVVVEVGDTGIGIPREHLPRVFERFYVVDKSRSKKLGGTGLGLSIVKHIVLLHGGRIEVDSIPGRGTTFTVTLPTGE